MLVGVCDFPGSYAFPPSAYGGIERWLWATAVGARKAGAEVHLLGPQWQTHLAHGWPTAALRLEDMDPDNAADLKKLADYDLLIVGHEYPSQPNWRRVFDRLDCEVATFQHAPAFQHHADAFDGRRSRLFCYSTEMMERYATHSPRRTLAVHLGLNEEEPPAVEGEDLVWLGRIDREKAPHLAIMAAQRLGRRIKVVGPVFDRSYVDAHQEHFGADHVDFVGELGGREKTLAFGDAAAFVYTYARDYIEAGAAVFGESLRAGTPVAALAWRQGTCADAALCAETGSVAHVDPRDDDTTVAQRLAEAVEQCMDLKAERVQEVGLARFDEADHFKALAQRD